LLIDRVEAGHDHDRDPLQYRCDHTLNVINLGRFSRRRSDNEETTGTVMG